MIYLSEKSVIHDNEISFSFSRSGGPGGQNVNKVETAVLLKFDIENSSLDEAVKARLSALAKNKIAGGSILINSREHRKQLQNRTRAVEKLIDLIKEAEKEPLKRKKKKISNEAKERRLQAKKRQKMKKSERKSVNPTGWG